MINNNFFDNPLDFSRPIFPLQNYKKNELVYQHNKTFVSAELIDIGLSVIYDNRNDFIIDFDNNAYWPPTNNPTKFLKISNDGSYIGFTGADFTSVVNSYPIFITSFDRYTYYVQPPAILDNKIYIMPYNSNGKMAYINNGEVLAISNSSANYFNYFRMDRYNFHIEPYIANDGTVYYYTFVSSKNAPMLLKLVDNTTTEILPYFKQTKAFSIRDKNNNIYYIGNDLTDSNNPKTHVTKITSDNIVTTNIYDFDKSQYLGSIYDEKLDIHYLIPYEGTKIAVLKNGEITKSNIDILPYDNDQESYGFNVSDIEIFRDINNNLYLPPYYTKNNVLSKRIIKFSNGEISLVGDNAYNTSMYNRSIPYRDPITKSIYYPPSSGSVNNSKILKIDYFGNISYIPISNSGTFHLSYPAVDQLGYIWYGIGNFIKIDIKNDLAQNIIVNTKSIQYSYINPLYLDNGDIIIISIEKYIYKISYGEVSLIFDNSNWNISADFKPYMDKNRNYYYVACSKILKITQSGEVILINGDEYNYSFSCSVGYKSHLQFMDKEKNFYAIPSSAAFKNILKIEYETGNVSIITDVDFSTNTRNKSYIDNNGNMYFLPGTGTGSETKILKLNFN
jgi:hypothetical protein